MSIYAFPSAKISVTALSAFDSLNISSAYSGKRHSLNIGFAEPFLYTQAPFDVIIYLAEGISRTYLGMAVSVLPVAGTRMIFFS